MPSTNEMFKLHEDIIKNEMLLSSNIYVELGFLKYLKLGKLLACENMNAEMYRKIIEVLEGDTFLHRHTDCTRVVFEDVRGLSSLCDSCDMSPSFNDQHLLLSPPFSAEQDIIKHIQLSKLNKTTVSDNTVITVHINIAELPGLSVNVIKCLKFVYMKALGVNVEIINKDIHLFSEAEILEYDTFFIYDLPGFNDTFVDLLDRREFFHKYIYTRKLLPEIMLLDETVNVGQFFKEIDAIMNCACEFNIVNNPYCLIGNK